MIDRRRNEAVVNSISNILYWEQEELTDTEEVILLSAKNICSDRALVDGDSGQSDAQAYWDRVHDVEKELVKEHGHHESSISTKAQQIVNGEWENNGYML